MPIKAMMTPAKALIMAANTSQFLITRPSPIATNKKPIINIKNLFIEDPLWILPEAWPLAGFSNVGASIPILADTCEYNVR